MRVLFRSLLHVKNFCAATWDSAIAALAGAGFRGVAVDQVGFCKSSKPRRYQFSFGQLADNTHALLQSLRIERAVVVGHSMGGMLAARYALQYPLATGHLVLVNPIGLADWRAEGVPWRNVDAWYAGQLKTGSESTKAYPRKFYCGRKWQTESGRSVGITAGRYVRHSQEGGAVGTGLGPAER